MAIFFTSDTHFGHAGARSLYRRPFDSVPEMDAAMCDRWNATVGPDDEIWHLGDFAVGLPAARMAELLGRLNGRKHLITGNNDLPETTSLAGWSSVHPLCRNRSGRISCRALPLRLSHLAQHEPRLAESARP
jgi:calcineurin-like phosphoesterase family protein